MMRLQRVGRKNDPSYRVVVVDKRTGPKSNKNIDVLGSYNPKMNNVQIDAEKAKVWLSKGVQPSDTVHNILVGQKVIDAKKLNVLPKKSPIVGEEKEEEQKETSEETISEESESASDDSVKEDSSDNEPKEEGKVDEAEVETEEEKIEESTEAKEEVEEQSVEGAEEKKE